MTKSHMEPAACLSWAMLPIEIRAAVLDHIDNSHDFVACMLASRLFYEAATETQRRMWRYAPDRPDAPDVFGSDEPLAVVAAVWNRWAHHLDLDYDEIIWGPAQSGCVEVLRFACAIVGLTSDAQPAGPCLCPKWRECACGDSKQTDVMRSDAFIHAVYAAAASGHTDAVLYLINVIAALTDLRPHALCTAASHAQIHVIEALSVDRPPDRKTIVQMIDNALDNEHPNVVLWLYDHGWADAEVMAPFLERLLLVAASCACASDFEGAWRLLVLREPDSVRRWWRAAMLKAGSSGNVGALGWLLDNPPGTGMPPSSSSANVVSHALIRAIEHGHLDAAVLLRERGATVSLTMFQCALRWATTDGHADAVVPLCEAFYDPAFMKGGHRLVECACEVDHVGLLAFACERFGPHLAVHAWRWARASANCKGGRVLLWLDKHFPSQTI
ncbi:hypothetical protein pclt_cds_832 [Pandoravirus celtis]|uniref:Ankyrin repeat domain containing protein n=1 Tax=Pandoravirus celtis TaxID=2568002 RepID=A0A4D6EJT4_9VIRU|nr:hypothetical protein pclt_cds_832 [Pandoravirus celtis]